jgi:hypothetical protein
MALGGDDVVDAWYRGQDGEVRGKVDALLEHLGNRHRAAWRRPQFDLLAGICKGLAEIRIKARSGEHRLLGYFGPERMAFTILTCFKKTRDADTDAACRIGQIRRKDVAYDVSRARPCSFP